VSVEEIERRDLPCACPCGRTWLMSRGRIVLDGAIVSFVVMPTLHDDRDCWMAIGRGERPAEWVLTRSWTDDDGSVASAVIDARDSALAAVPAFVALGGTVLSRERVMGEDARRRHTFAAHDAIVRDHPDVQNLLDPQRGRDLSFGMPDCVFAQPTADRSRRNSENLATCDGRLFVRALLPIAVLDGSELRVGVWVEVDEASFMALVQVFWDDEEAYVATELTGPIENSMSLSGHDVRGVPVTLAARTADKCLFVREAGEPWLASLMKVGVTVGHLPELIHEINLSVDRLPN